MREKSAYQYQRYSGLLRKQFKCKMSKKIMFFSVELHYSTIAEDVERFSVASAATIMSCYQGLVLLTLSESVRSVPTLPNVKKSFLKDI